MNDPQFSELVTKGKKNKRKNKYMTDIEYDVSCYYDAKGGKDKEKYSEELEDELQRREMKDRQQKFAAFADIMPITASHISVPLNIMAAGEQVIDTAKYVTTGDVDYNTNSLGASTIRSTVSKKIENPIGSFTYNTAMSGVDSLAAMGLSKVITGSSELGSVILGLSAAGNATNDAINRGLSDRYAFASGVAAGVFETLFESWSIGKFSEGVDNLSLDDVENLSTFFGKNLWNNAWEEGLTDVANISYDILVNNKYSQYESSIRNYMISGLSETDAKRQVALELAGQVAEAAASGSLMSFGFSSAGVTKTAVANQINANIERAKNELQLKTTNAVTNPIESYHSEKQSLIRSFLNSVDNEFKKLVQRVKKENNNFERYKISEVSTRETKDIKNLFGIDVSGYTHNINSDGIRHILKRHGENGQQDNTMSNIDDIARVGWVIENYDTVEAITKNGKQVYSSLFTDKNNNPALQIRYSKKINGTYYVVESVFENKYKKLWVQSAYLSNKREVVTQAPDAADRLPMVTSKTPPASPTSMLNISQDKKNVNKEETIKGVASQSGAAPFISKDGSIKAVPNITEKDGIRTIGVEKIIDEKAFVERLWENSPNNPKNNVEKSQVESVENTQGNGIIEKTAENDIGVPGEYPDSIVWQRRKVPARKFGKGYFGARTKQHDSRVDSYELKLNPNNESYFLIHLDGNPVQFENMKNGVVQDCKLVMGKNSIYYVKEKIPILNKNILQQAKRQLEAANLVGYRVEWLVSDKRAVEQMKQLFYENNLDIIVTYYPE